MADTSQNRRPDRGKTEALLMEAAFAEFADPGYAGTDSNKIARRAGFAPQTFYRWFKDKRDIFLAVYRQWEEMEAASMKELARKGASASEQVKTLIAHHRDHRIFRRTLRQLSLEDEEVRRARAESRRRQLERIAGKVPSTPELERLAVTLLEIERLCDAIAEDELADLGVTNTEGLKELERLIKTME